MKKIYFSLLLCVLVYTGIQAQTFTFNSVNYEVTDTMNLYAQVNSNNTTAGVVTIPETVTDPNTNITYTVTALKLNSFFNNQVLTGITIPNTVTTIGINAFWGCSNLASVSFGNSVMTIETSAFQHCSSLTSITIPDTVTSIGTQAFGSCAQLASVTIGEGNGAIAIGEKAFESCVALTSLTLSDSVISIGDSAFIHAPLTSITIPASVTSIGTFAFWQTTGELTCIISLNPTPPTLAVNAFFGETYTNAQLKVPASSIDAYSMAGEWLKFTSIVAETIAPTLISSNPLDDAIDVAIDTNFELTFSEDVVKGTGNITIHDASDDSVVETIDVTNAAVSIVGAVVTINPIADLGTSTSYYMNIEATALNDLSNNNYAGIADATTYNFTTDASLSIEDISDLNNVKVYPNPSQGKFAISSISKPLKAIVYDLQGRLILSKSISNSAESINIIGQRSGVYYLQITTEQGNTKVYKLVKK